MKFFLSTFILSMILAQAQANQGDRLVSVSGECSLQVIPDRGSITVTIDHLNRDVKISTQKTAEVYSKFKKEIESLNLKGMELKTTEYQVFEQKDWEKNTQVSKGFRARMGLNISTEEIARLGDIMNAASKQGITDVSNLNTYVSDSKLKSLETSCLKEAAVDSRKKADALASALNAKVKEVVTITTADVNLPTPRPYEARMMHKSMAMNDAGGSPSIEAGKEKYTLKINATFRID